MDKIEENFWNKLFRRPSLVCFVHLNVFIVCTYITIFFHFVYFKIELIQANTEYHQSLKYGSDESSYKNETVLRRVFTLPTLVFFAISGTIGSGIYIIAGSAGKDMAGAGLIFSMIVAGFVALTNGLVVAEFASRVPLIGGDYTYTFLSSGEFLGFILGWFSLTREPISNSISAIAVAYYLYSFLDAMDILPPNMENSYWFGKEYPDRSWFSINIVAPILVIISAIFVYCGIKINNKTLTVVAIWNMSLLLLFGFAGLFLFDFDVMINPCDHTEYGDECPSDAENSMLPFGFQGSMMAAGIAFWSFIGPERIVYIAEECVNPMRDIPRAIYISYVLIFLLYIFVIIVLSGMVPFQSLDSRAPLAQAFSAHDEKLLMGISSLGALTAITGVFFQIGVGAVRVYLRLSIDGMIPTFCKRIHPKYRTPTIAIYYFFSMVLIISTFLDFTFLLELYSSLTLILMGLSQCSLLVMRFSPPELMDKYKKTDFAMIPSSPFPSSPSPSPHSPNTPNTPNTSNSPNTPNSPQSPNILKQRQQTMMKIGRSRSNYQEVYITQFWTHTRVLLTIYSYFIWVALLCIIVVHRDWFIDNDRIGILIILLTLLVLLVLLSGVFIVYFHCEFPWLEWLNEYERNHKIHWMPFGPYLNLFAIGVDCYLLSLLLFPNVYYEAIAIMFIGLLFYFGYSYNHSYFREEKQKLIMRHSI